MLTISDDGRAVLSMLVFVSFWCRFFFVFFQGVLHAAGLGGPWYGSDDVVDSVRAVGYMHAHLVSRTCPLKRASASLVFG